MVSPGQMCWPWTKHFPPRASAALSVSSGLDWEIRRCQPRLPDRQSQFSEKAWALSLGRCQPTERWTSAAQK